MFQYLYVQTEYSILQSACKIKPLIEKLKEQQLHSCAIVDEGTMYGTIKFYQECNKNNIKPVIGLKVKYHYNDKTNNLVLLAINNFGYQNLMKISSRLQLTNNNIDFEYLQKTTMGLIAILPYEESLVQKYLERNDAKNAIQTLELLKEIYSDFYIGLGIKSITNSNFIDNYFKLLKNYNYQFVALPKVSFINESDYDAYTTLKAIKNNGVFVEGIENDKNNYLHDVKSVETIYYNHYDMLENTSKIANMCNVQIEFGKYQLPLYESGLDSFAYLKELCSIGLEKRMQNFEYSYDKRKYYDRLNYELNVINEMGFSDYFLIVYDYVKYAKKNNIFVGPGRGSAPASLVAYSLGITEIDPLYYNLLFERFLNKERLSMPDIDIDFPDDRRDEVIRYVGKKYGKNRVAHILTFGTFKIRQAINDCARVFKLNDVKTKEIYKHLQAVNTYKVYDNPSLKTLIEASSDLQLLMNNYEDINKVLTIACKIQDIPRNISTHAAGIVITKFDLVNYTPLDEGLDEIYQTQYEAKDLEALGLLKMDFLGLKNLTNIAKTIELIRKDIPDFTLPKNENDYDTYKMMREGDLTGVFQLESAGMRKVIMQLKTSTFDDITHALALYRPGPMDIIPSFIRRKFNEEKVEYPHKDLEPILKETYGMIVYQDQIMLIACKFAGYTLGRADILRRAVSKKKKEVLEQERINFVESSVNRGYSSDTANMIYDYIVKFADYGFNKAHSVAYAKIAYLTAYLKCHYFAYYMSTLMTSFMGSSSEMLEYTKEATKKNVEVLNPNIKLSTDEFEVINGKIYFPLSIIKGLGEIKTKQCIEERTKAKFKGYEDFVERTKDFLAISLLENIIYSGALDDFGLTKKAMIENLKSIIDRSNYGFIKDMIKTDYTDEEFSYGILQEKELEVIGINIKYNFYQQFASFYSKYNLVKIANLSENKEARTIGTVKRVRETKTKNNETMAFVEITDDTSNIEIVLFPMIYQQIGKLQNGMILMISGKTQKRMTLQIIVDRFKIIS
ncbi:MAG: DNA polymerase III subunit alpha [Acholeplasmatales bacterium]|nr:DNA polymerase III subunit alpha [Acholeplasmatales bacterium]MDY4016996.1 DNA polymerase III subunit alpha [Bacilli bacterium]